MSTSYYGINDASQYSTAELQNLTEKLIQGQNQESIVLVHATWCGHCKDFQAQNGTWQQFKNIVQKKMNVIEIESSVLEKHNMGLNVMSFPTLFHIKNGEIKQFQGNRELQSLLQFVNVEQQQSKQQQIFGGGKPKRSHRKRSQRKTKATPKRRKSTSRRRKATRRR